MHVAKPPPSPLQFHSRIWHLCVCICYCIAWMGHIAPVQRHAPTSTSTPSTTMHGFGINTHLATRLREPTSIDTGVHLLAEGGVRWVREDVHWYRIQRTPQAAYWDYYDRTFMQLHAQHINILGVLGHAPGWATAEMSDNPYGISFYAPDPDLFASWAAKTVARYRGIIHYWQIGNEPDNAFFWRPHPDPHAYATLVRRTVAAIARVAPEVRIVAAGTNPYDATFLIHAAQAGLWNDIDIVAIHPYVNPAPPNGEGITASVAYLAPLFARYGTRPVWVTEIGWGSGPSDRDPAGINDAAQQATYLRQVVPLLWHAGVELVFWYALKDEAHNPYGLIAWGAGSDDFQIKKPAWWAWQHFDAISAPQHRTMITSFEDFAGIWIRGDEPYGHFAQNNRMSTAGSQSMQLVYDFPAQQNRYVVFRRRRLLPIPAQSTAICMQIYGDNSAHRLKLWLKDRTGAVFQLVLGPVGPAHWHELCATIPNTVDATARIWQSDGIVRPPLSLEAIVLDDNPDGIGGHGTLYVDALSSVRISPTPTD